MSCGYSCSSITLYWFSPALQSPEGEFLNSAAMPYIDCEDEQHVLDQATPGQIRDAVMYVL
jgi:hypothetical protein